MLMPSPARIVALNLFPDADPLDAEVLEWLMKRLRIAPLSGHTSPLIAPHGIAFRGVLLYKLRKENSSKCPCFNGLNLS